MKITGKTVREILGQPVAWATCLKLLRNLDLAALVNGHRPEQGQWIFVGCGTSYYLAQAAAASFYAADGKTGARASGFGDFALSGIVAAVDGERFSSVDLPVGAYLGDSGLAEVLTQKRIEFLALTCDGNELAESTNRVLQLPVKEESTVMTSSFTSMLLAMQFVARSLRAMPNSWPNSISYPLRLSRCLQSMADNSKSLQTNPLKMSLC